MPPTTDQDFDRLVSSFKAIAALGTRLRQEFTLCQVASFHGLPRAEFRRLYRIWLTEQAQQAIGRGEP
ncbi:MAG TPA: hypothetical protein V6D18_17025 [Thermosynechococcaceae cyanobacterium]